MNLWWMCLLSALNGEPPCHILTTNTRTTSNIGTSSSVNGMMKSKSCFMITLGLFMVYFTQSTPRMKPSVRLPASPMNILRFLDASPKRLKYRKAVSTPIIPAISMA